VKCGALDVTLRNSKAGLFFIRPAQDVRLINDEFGPWVNDSSTIGPSGECPQPPRRILLDHVYMHDFHTEPFNSVHIECLQVNLADGLAIRNSRFRRCEDFDILVKRDFGDINLSNLTFENNLFGAPFPDGTTALHFSDPQNAAYTNVVIRNNSFAATLILSPGVTYSTVRVTGNAGMSAGGPCGQGILWSYNVWANRRCNRTERRALPGFRDAANFDFRLVRGAAAINHGDPRSFPTRDVQGRKRPIGTQPDAGAVESLYGKGKPAKRPREKSG
jgi:hypothetical protein